MKTNVIEWSASLLAAPPLHLHTTLISLQKTNISCMHLDIMDLHYVPNTGLSIDTIVSIAKAFPHLKLDVHCMTNHVDLLLKKLPLKAMNIRTLYFHPDCAENPINGIRYLHEHNIKAGVAINPSQTPEDLNIDFNMIDACLVMGVNPGFSGQSFQPSTIKTLHDLQKIKTNNPFSVALDGGMNPNTLKHIPSELVDHIVLGSALLNTKCPMQNLQACQQALLS